MEDHGEYAGVKKDWIKISKFLNQPKVLWATITILFLIILMVSVNIRVSNLPLLVDSTNGKMIPLALDPYFFLRLTETLASPEGFPAYDAMRAPALQTAWYQEILPDLVVGMHKAAKVFNPNLDLRLMFVLSPVIFFIIGLILFFFMGYAITGSKWASLIASALLAFSPAFVYRTTAGFADHDSLGMLAIFGCFLVYALALRSNRLEKNWKNSILWGLFLGFMTAFTLVSWGGAITFLLLTIPTAFILYYLFNSKNKIKAIVFYILWLTGGILFPLLFHNPINLMIARYTSAYGLLVPFALAFILIDYALSNIKLESKYFKKKYQELYSVGITLILGLIGLIAVGKHPVEMLSEIWFKLMNPFGSAVGRLSATVAENSQPYLNDWIGQTGPAIFWIFFIGIILIGISFSLKIQKRRYQAGFVASWILFVSAILFSRISASSSFNGTNFISQFFYFVGLLVFGSYFLFLITKTKFEVHPREILFLSIIIFVLIYGRSASRIFFLIIPFMFLVIGNLVVRSIEYALRVKDDVLKIIFWGLFIIALIISLSGIYSYHGVINNSVKNTAPSANSQWQESMSWVRNNTMENDIFVHWWDYGYWVQTLGERPTVTDGGHAGGDTADHSIGRYVLTTPNPISALTYMKTWNVSYLLIDPTDLGKYPAYSKIGSDLEWDRFSIISVMPANPKQILETLNGTTIVYSGTSGVDEDIIYESNDSKPIFIPGPNYDYLGNPTYKAYVIGSIIKIKKSGDTQGFEQPSAVYYYNGNQINIPIRYIELNGQIMDFKTGLDAVLKIIPSFDGNRINNMGAVIYLSSRVQKGLFARLYLMNDAFDQYPTIKLAHSEDDYVVNALNANGVDIGDFIFYQGFRGPIKIWEVDYPENTTEEPRFLTNHDFDFGWLDEEFY